MELPRELEEAIHAAPDDREVYLVAGDWLQQQGALQGELVVTDERDRMIALLPPSLRSASPFTIEWRWGFVHGVLVSSMQDAAEPGLLRELLVSPIARFVQKLVVQQASSRLIEAIAEAAEDPQALRCLRTLMVFAESERPIDLARVRMPALRRLVVRARSATGALDLPNLLELAMDRVLDVSSVIAASSLPNLAMLQVSTTFDPLEPNRWLDPELLPALRIVSLSTMTRAPIDTRVWLESRIAPLLAQLDLFAVVQSEPSSRQFLIDRQPPSQSARALIVVGKDRGTTRDASAIAKWAYGQWRAYMGNGRTFVNGHHVTGAAGCALRGLDEVALGGEVFRIVDGPLSIEHLAKLGYSVP